MGRGLWGAVGGVKPFGTVNWVAPSGNGEKTCLWLENFLSVNLFVFGA